jgi:alkylated DNA repair dioxygenase AlkB
MSEYHSISVIANQVYLYPGFLQPGEADHYFRILYEAIEWQQEQLFVFGRKVSVPRLVAWYGDEKLNYRYSGVDHVAWPWNPTLLEIRDRVCEQVSASFNGVLLNLYRDGQDSMGWHSDDEAELGGEPLIASVSLGQERSIQFRRKHRHAEKVSQLLPHGSLLIMQGKSQEQWQHQIPRRKKLDQPRINLTFRKIFSG